MEEEERRREQIAERTGGEAAGAVQVGLKFPSREKVQNGAEER